MREGRANNMKKWRSAAPAADEVINSESCVTKFIGNLFTQNLNRNSGRTANIHARREKWETKIAFLRFSFSSARQWNKLFFAYFYDHIQNIIGGNFK